jgi:fido (protein-threonine AMPylation protein)
MKKNRRLLSNNQYYSVVKPVHKNLESNWYFPYDNGETRSRRIFVPLSLSNHHHFMVESGDI